MHFLDRSTVAQPECLANWSHQINNWEDFTKTPEGAACKKQVSLALQRLQSQQIIDENSEEEAEFLLGLRCAYCEGQIFYGGHIEHFRRKNAGHFPELTFEWTNLFLACGSNDHCGHYKDRPNAPAYDPDELIKPDCNDPDDFLYFHSSGEVRIRSHPSMTDQDRIRGKETIRVFHLNCGQLRGARSKVLNRYKSINTGFLEELMLLDENERQEFVDAEIEATKYDAYWTTIRHFFEALSG